MSKAERVPEAVIEIINNLEEENLRKLSKAKTRFHRKVSEIFEHYGEKSPNVIYTAKIPVENSGTTYYFWMIGSRHNRGADAILRIQPENDSQCYQVFEIANITNKGLTVHSRTGEVQTLDGFLKLNTVLDYLEQELQKSKETAQTKYPVNKS